MSKQMIEVLLVRNNKVEQKYLVNYEAPDVEWENRTVYDVIESHVRKVLTENELWIWDEKTDALFMSPVEFDVISDDGMQITQI